MGTSDQPCFDTGTSTRGLSTGVTVGGTGSSLVQTTGAAAQRVHLPEVTATIETLISPVQNFGPVPVLSRLLVGSQKSSKGYRFKQDYRLHRVAGGEIQQGYWLRRIAGSGNRSAAGSGTGVLLVTEKSAVLIITGKEPASNPVLTTGSPVTEVSRLQRIEGDKLVGQEVSSVKFL